MYSAGTVIVASSAGAMVMGEHVLSNPYQLESNNAKIQWKEGMKLINYSVIPHYDYIVKNDKNLYTKLMDQTPNNIKEEMLGIDENTALFVADGKLTKKLGAGNVISVVSGDIYNFQEMF